jgi:transcriptional regulator with XRE-family HTH domain
LSTELLTSCPIAINVSAVKTWERIAERINTETKPVYHLTKGEVARKLNMTRPALTRRLSGETAWHIDEIEKLAKLFGVSVNELISNNDGSVDQEEST